MTASPLRSPSSRVAATLALLFSGVLASGSAKQSAQPSAPTTTIAPLPVTPPGPTFTVDGKSLPKNPTIIVYGDTRFTDPKNTEAANPAARRFLVAKIAEEHPDAVQLSGDLPYGGNNQGDYAQYALETPAWRAANLRIYPALGNHEFVGPNKAADLENWWSAFPALRNLRWYSVQFGPKIYFLNLDSTADLTPGTEQRRWLEDQIAHLAPSVEFLFVALHHPPVADIQTRYQVDHNPRPNEISLRDYFSSIAPSTHARILVAAGHIHNYERAEKDGVTYLVSGGGGARPYMVDRTPGDAYQSSDFPNFHYVKFTLKGKQMSATMFRLADPNAASPVWQPRDTFTLKAK